MRLFRVLALLLRKGADLHFPKGRLRFAREYAKWEVRVRFRAAVEIDRNKKLTVVLLSYKRPQNIEPLVRSALKCAFVARVIVCNNNPEFRMEKWVGVSEPRLLLLDQKENLGPGYRFHVAAREPGEYFCFIDDDVFLYPEQIRKLFGHLLEDPSVPHGVRGQIVFDNQDFLDGIYGRECKVDILNGVYFFTKAHLSEYFRLDEKLNGIPRVDDIVLSFSGGSAPRCHDVGEILLCPTESVSGIAIWKETDFRKHRLRALQKLSNVKPLKEPALSLPPLANLPVLTGEPLFSIDTVGDDIDDRKQPLVISRHTRSLVVRGWAVDGRARALAGGVYLDLDGMLYPAYYGATRNDVAGYFRIDSYARSGFQRSFFNLEPGSHRISLAILGHNSKAYYKPDHSIQFEIRPPGLSQRLSYKVRKRESNLVDDRPIRVKLVRNLFSHWAEHSGAHQFVRYTNGCNFQFEQAVVPPGSDGFRFGSAKFQEWLRRAVKKRGIQWYDLNNLQVEAKTVLNCFGTRPDIIHCLDGEYVQYLPVVLRRLGYLGKFPPVIASFHQPPEILQQVLNNEIVRLLDHVIVYCGSQASYFERFLESTRVSIVPHGIDTEYFRPARRKADVVFKCLTVGFWLRDFETLWKVVTKLRGCADIEFHLVTSKQIPPEPFTQVKFYQSLDDDVLLRLYQDSDLLFMPLLDSAANNAILEAAACGLPIVSSAVGGVLEYTDQSFALLVPPGDSDGLADAILKLRSQPERRHQMRLAARSFVEQNLAWPKVTDQILELYRDVLAARLNDPCDSRKPDFQ
jgi:glycosyltransferase involved in cell wall biosynthesis